MGESARSGPAVYRGYTQAELDRQYDPRTTVPDVAPFLAYYRDESAAARRDLEHLPDIRYGAGPHQCLDLFPSSAQHAPVVCFVHGGAWQRLSKEDGAFAARVFTERGAHFAAIGFDRIPAVTLADMVREVREAVAWMHQHVARHGGDPGRVHVVGHSSGAHLAAMLLAGDWQQPVGVPSEAVRGVTLISGLYDLEPVMRSARSSYLGLDPEAERRLSPIRQMGGTRCPVIVCSAAGDTAEFIRQSAALRDACAEQERLSAYLLLEGRNHFDVVESLADPTGPLARAVLEEIGLA